MERPHETHALQQSIRERLDHWERALRDALEHTEITEEKRRFERELAELGQARAELGGMDEPDLERLRERLRRDPTDWIEHHAPER